MWRGERHLVFQRNGVLVGEHDLPEIDVRQDLPEIDVRHLLVARPVPVEPCLP